MKRIAYSVLLALGAAVIPQFACRAERFVGGDISLLPEYENAGAKYRTHEGKQIDDLLPWCREEGMNAMRVRLFVDPSKYTGQDADPNACQTLEYITPLCQRIVNDGFSLMLDFHYSDTWADPAKQYTPADWADLSDEELYQKIYDYTKECLLDLKEAGVVPQFIQPGNEISYGMLWGPQGTPDNEKKKVYMGSNANWERFGKLLRQAIKACKEVCPDAKIVLHTERVAQVNVLKNFYDKMKQLDVEYEIIGLSYYPYWHGDLDQLDNALNTLEDRYPEKEIMIVETGYPYKWAVPGTDIDLSGKYPYSDAGQNKFAKQLVETLEAHSHVNGLFWWWMEYNAYGTSLGNWYNAPLFDSTNGRATSAFKTICSFASDSAVGSIVDEPQSNDNSRYYNLAGMQETTPARGVYVRVSNGKTDKILK